MDNAIIKTLIEEVIAIIDGNLQSIDDGIKNHFLLAVSNFREDEISFSQFADRCFAQRLISSLHWTPELENATDKILYSDLERMQIDFPW